MHIALISPYQNPYSETFIQAHKKLLKGKVFYYYGSPENARLEGVGELQKDFRKYIYRIQRKLFKKSHSWYHQRFLKQSFIENKINVVLAEYGPTAHMYLPLIKKMELPLIVHFHGYDASVYSVIERHEGYKKIFEYASAVVVVSKKMYKVLQELGCPVEKLTYNVYGPQEDFFNLKPTFSNQQFLAVGRFVDKKAPYLTVLAFKEVLNKFPNATLLLAGDGALYNTCKNLITQFNLERNVFLIGVISPQKVQEYLENSIAFVQHSVTALNGDEEGTPVSILEAGAAGLPVISTNHAGIPDVVQDGVTGFLVEEHDVKDMGLKMISLLKEPLLARKLGTNARQRIKENFTLKQHIDILDQLVEKASLDNKSGYTIN